MPAQCHALAHRDESLHGLCKSGGFFEAWSALSPEVLGHGTAVFRADGL
eukprot:SAG11_NODE_1629_length_4547_cov_2.310701_6_plen_48_part_01